jgi:hypothetical protein
MGSSGANAGARRRALVDPRLLIGLALVGASVAGVVGIVAANDDGVQVYSAPRLLTAGTVVTPADLTVSRVSLGSDLGAYLPVGSVPDQGAVITRTVGAGELIPRAAIGDERGPTMTTIVVSLTTPLGGTVRVGDVLDVWASPQQEAGRFGPPAVISAGAQLVREVTEEGLMARSSAARVELLVLRRDIARLLDALANGDALAAVPVSLAVSR